ncbi:S-layer homology domain-containing protein [Flavonifractor hominis]|uniref:S-layer homology domain-containing protein n=1 Tax=Flavonifractor hominis TaxID=3133178 RepID=A0ABV1EK11_9FIRM
MEKQIRKLHRGVIRRVLSCVLTASLLCTCFVTTSFAAESEEATQLTYTVADGLDFDDTSTFVDSESAWGYADTIVEHVESAVEDMQEIFDQRTVSILDYGAEASERVSEDDVWNWTEDELAEETRLAKVNTQAIYDAIKDVSEAGGGTVVVPAQDGKVFYTAAIHLEDNVNLCVEEGATLAFSVNTELYQGDFMKQVYGDGVDDKGLTLTRFESVELMNYSPFIYAYGKKNVAITGGGTLDGQATVGDGVDGSTGVWQPWKNSGVKYYTDSEGVQHSMSDIAQVPARNKLFAQGQMDVPVSERQYGEAESEPWEAAGDGYLRPNFIQPYNCQNVLIEGIRIENSPMWEINPVLCDTVMVDGVYVESHMGNNDGCDPECTSNMVIQNSTFNVGDDCIAIKSGRNGDGLRVDRASFNIVIQNNEMVDGHGGVTIGSEITGGVKNIFSRNNDMESSNLQVAYRFKTNYIRGGVIENIYYKGDTVNQVSTSSSSHGVIIVDLNYDISSEVAAMEEVPSRLGIDPSSFSYKAYMPEFKNVVVEDLMVNEAGTTNYGGANAIKLTGFSKDGITGEHIDKSGITDDCYISGFTVKNSTFNSSKTNLALSYVDGLTLDNVTFTGGSSNSSVSNTKNVTFTNCDLSASNVSRSLFENLEGVSIDEYTTFAGERPYDPLETAYDINYLASGDAEVSSKTYDENTVHYQLSHIKDYIVPGGGFSLDGMEESDAVVQYNKNLNTCWFQIYNMTEGNNFYFTTPIKVSGGDYTAELSYKDGASRGSFDVVLVDTTTGTEYKLGSIDEAATQTGTLCYSYLTPQTSVTIPEGEYYLRFDCTKAGDLVAIDLYLHQQGVPVTGVTLNQSSMTLYYNDSTQNKGTLTATITPDDATDKTVTWSSSNPTVASVDENGTVTALAAGTATITATTADGAYQASCLVTSNYFENESDDVKYDVILPSSLEHGTITATPAQAGPNAEVTLTIEPDDGYVLDTLTVTNQSGAQVAVTTVSNGTCTFRMPAGGATVSATFRVSGSGETPTSGTFTDVAAGQWYYEAVEYVSDNGIMNGIGGNLFAPTQYVTRAMVAQVLYNMEGRPAVTTSAGFTDVSSSDWYASAVNWAAATGLVDGYGNGRFGGNDNVTREQMVVILYRYAQYKGYDTTASTSLAGYADAASASSWATEGLSWGVGAGVINGKSSTQLDPLGTATRAEIAQIMMNFCENIAE